VWPTPRASTAAAWVEVEGPLVPCARGVHLCRPVDLAHWINDELWEVEAEGDRVAGIDSVIVRRARLLRPIAAWQDGGASRFLDACIERAESLVDRSDPARALVDDARSAASAGHVSGGAYCAAVAVARRFGPEGVEAAFRKERTWQGQWIARELLDA
jgi:hypothetical protein